MKKLYLLIILLINFNLFSISINPSGHITSTFTVSNMEPVQGEIVVVNVLFSMDKTSHLFKEGKEYLIQDAYFSENHVKNHPEDLAEKYNWEVVYSDSSKIISDKIPEVRFTYSLKLKNSPDAYTLLGLHVAELKDGATRSIGVIHTGNLLLLHPQKSIPPKKDINFRNIELNIDTEYSERNLCMNFIIGTRYNINSSLL